MKDREACCKILGVASNADLAEIRCAYRRFARSSHPDLHPDDPQAEGRFKEVTEAYEVLRGEYYLRSRPQFRDGVRESAFSYTGADEDPFLHFFNLFRTFSPQTKPGSPAGRDEVGRTRGAGDDERPTTEDA